MELHTLRCFVGVAEQLSFSRASIQLHLSQPALSRQVRALEAELGMPLFDRIGRRIRLTSAGEELAVRARLLLQDVDSFKTRAEDLSQGSTGTLRIGATPQTLEGLIAPLIAKFRRIWPKVDFQLIEDGAANLLDQVQEGSVQIAIAALPTGTTLQGQELFPFGVLAVVPAGNPIARRKRVDVTELAREPLLLLRKAFMTRQLFDGACKIAHIAPPVVIESSSPHAIVSLANQHHGIAIIPSTVQVSAQHAIPVQIGGRQLGVRMSAIWNPRRYLPPAALAFVEEARRYTRREYPGKAFSLTNLFDSSANGPMGQRPVCDAGRDGDLRRTGQISRWRFYDRPASTG